jgi:hypothetical protein
MFNIAGVIFGVIGIGVFVYSYVAYRCSVNYRNRVFEAMYGNTKRINDNAEQLNRLLNPTQYNK